MTLRHLGPSPQIGTAHKWKNNPPPPLPLEEPDAAASHHMIPMRDGTRLATDVYLPNAPGFYPTVLTRVPYDKNSPDTLVHLVAHWFVKHGYGFVAQDIRGKARSEGELHLFEHDADDGYDTIDWISTQPWSDGNVVMWGQSYFGFTQWAAASTNHPALRAIAPRNTTKRIGEGWLSRQGVPKYSWPAAWAGYVGAGTALYPVETADLDWTSPPRDVLSASLGGQDSKDFQRWLDLIGKYSEWDHNRDSFNGQPITIPALHIGGWFDLFRHSQIKDWQEAVATSSQPQLLIMHARDHTDLPWQNQPPRETFGQARLKDIITHLDSYLEPELAFFNAVLTSPETLAQLPRVRWETTNGKWHTEPWPPTNVTTTELFLHPDGTLSSQTPETTSTITWMDDANNPVPTTDFDEQTWTSFPADDSTLFQRPDVTVFAIALETGTEIAGHITATLELASSDGHGYAIAKLVDCPPSGPTRRIADGACTIDPTAPILEIDLGPTAYRVEPGHRIALVIAGSDFPKYLPDPTISEAATHRLLTLTLGGAGRTRVQYSAYT